MKSRSLIVAAGAWMMLLCAGCAHAPSREAYSPPAEEKTLGEEQEYRLGREVSASFLGRFPLRESAFNSYATTLARYLAQFSIRPVIFKGYRAVLVLSDEKVAFSTPGGFIFISQGLLSELQNEDELAGVLAHEIAHICLRHGELALTRQAMADQSRQRTSKALSMASKFSSVLGGGIGSTAASASGAYDSHLGEIHEKLLVSGYSQDQEYAADAWAARILLDAGYQPARFADFLSRTFSTAKRLFMPGVSGAGDLAGVTFLSSHPLDERRVDRLRSLSKGWRAGPDSPSRLSRFMAVKNSAGPN